MTRKANYRDFKNRVVRMIEERLPEKGFENVSLACVGAVAVFDVRHSVDILISHPISAADF